MIREGQRQSVMVSIGTKAMRSEQIEEEGREGLGGKMREILKGEQREGAGGWIVGQKDRGREYRAD